MSTMSLSATAVTSAPSPSSCQGHRYTWPLRLSTAHRLLPGMTATLMVRMEKRHLTARNVYRHRNKVKLKFFFNIFHNFKDFQRFSKSTFFFLKQLLEEKQSTHRFWISVADRVHIAFSRHYYKSKSIAAYLFDGNTQFFHNAATHNRSREIDPHQNRVGQLFL